MNGESLARLPTRNLLPRLRCGTCKFLGPPNRGEDQPTCRHNPPLGQVLTAVIETDKGPAVKIIGQATFWPAVPAGEFCHQWAQRIATAQTLDEAVGD
jgi:hypothetical protein